jgi:hypothetical protein
VLASGRCSCFTSSLGPGCLLRRFPSRSLMAAVPDQLRGSLPAVALVVTSSVTPLVAAGSVLNRGLFVPFVVLPTRSSHQRTPLSSQAPIVVSSDPQPAAIAHVEESEEPLTLEL